MAGNDDNDRPGTPAATTATPSRRWLRRGLIALAAVAVLLGGAAWLLGREATLQQIVQRVASASGGQIAATGVTGSLYGRMHIDRLVHRTPEGVLTVNDITIDWSPLQYFSDGVAISELHIASAVQQTLKIGEPAKLPDTLAPPFRLAIADARLDQLTLTGLAGASKGSENIVTAIRFKLEGDRAAWRLRDASAMTQVGRVNAEGTVGAQRPFKLEAKASLTQTTGIPAGAQPARLALSAGGTLALVELAAQGTSTNASGDGMLTLAPFDPIILRAMDIKGRGINPALFNPAWPQADLSLQLQARIAPNQAVSGKLSVLNQGQAGPLDQHRVPLRAIDGQLGGTLTATTVDNVMVDLGAAGQFAGGGRIQRPAMDAGVDAAAFQLHTARLDLHAIHGSIHATRIAGDITLGSTGDTQTLMVNLAQAGLRLEAQATLADALLRVKQARIVAGKGSVNLSAEASLKDQQPFSATATIARFDPSALGAYPAADLSANIDASGKLLPAPRVDATFKLGASRYLGQALSGGGTLRAQAKPVNAKPEAKPGVSPAGTDPGPSQLVLGADAKLALGKNTIAVTGGFGAPGERLAWRIDAPQLSAAASDLAGALTASGVATGTFAAPRSSFDASARGLGLASARKPVPDSVLQATGEVWLANGAAEIKAAGSAQRFNPAAFGPYGTGSINADFSGAGRLAADWRGTLDLRLQPSTLSGAPLTGYAKAAATHAHIDSTDIDLRLGPNSLQAKGGFGAPRDRLDWKVDAPQLAALGTGFGGTLRGAGTLTGTMAQPALSLGMEGAGLRLFGQHQIKALKASASVGSGQGANDPMNSELEVTGYASPGLALDKARFLSSGTRGAHTLQLSAANAEFDALVKVRGGSEQGDWKGVIETLQNKGRFALALQAPASLRLVAPPGAGAAGLARPEQITLAGAVVKLADGTIRIDSLEKNGARWRSKGAAAGVPVSYLAQLSDLWRDNIVSDLTLGANWALDMQAPQAKGAAPALEGALRLYREKGDVTVISGEKPIALGLRQLEARANVVGGALRVQLDLDGARAGKAHVEASTQLADGRVASGGALAMTGNVDIGSIAWLAPLGGMPGLELDGSLQVNATASGTIGEPVLNGDINGEKLVVNWAEQGVKLRNGRLQAKLAGDQLQLQRLYFDGDSGHAQADGWVRFANAEATMQLKLVADKLQVLSRPDRTLVVSGSSTLVRDQKHFQLDGKVKADRASIELASENTPTISDDVVILGRAKPGKAGAGGAAVPAMPLNVDLEADLGDNFRLKGKGLDAELAGTVRVRILDRRPPRATGSIRVVSGTYAAYGQKLSIERGVLNFTGAYDNPGLNILAVRKRPEGEQLSETNVEAGVEVRGTALAPQAKLVSTPSVPDSDKLSWLVLGHGMADTAGNEMALLGTAAGALFGGTGGGIAGKLGLDELGVSQAQGSTQAKGLENTVVTVGKRISSRAYLSFEQGAGTATSLVKLRYKLNPRITLQFQTGTNNALDVLYTWAFD
ncbi:translocation/assembly module TamB domain-containing protein [Pseudoduganella namucuonensis]|uniref:Translocation and assembly module TamB n=1 Tax=Pseudoduganella namucuonensis TaxID=1035707 RepID=A0A1I7IG65_9BURK|nr:translocation/assembly module TamB domain-containing protein [Pseudoduganella namucuonensis]SFU71902.1 translocation and assembly module TamB [Pseudoduganella namucuonensis]